MNYLNCGKETLEKEFLELVNQYEDVKGKGLKLNMARGKPSNEQVELSLSMLDTLNSSSCCINENGVVLFNM